MTWRLTGGGLRTPRKRRRRQRWSSWETRAAGYGYGTDHSTKGEKV